MAKQTINNRGHATIEVLISFIGAFKIMTFTMFFIMMIFLKIWVDHNTYEAAICMNSYPYPINSCQEDLNHQLTAVWPLGKLTLFYEKKSNYKFMEILSL
ncbi:MAG: hypothetical protein KDD58_00490 [Bdellovibrionales bacterium]|nr:hypothetical protein [Bdellovibrionales bacterium]